MGGYLHVHFFYHLPHGVRFKYIHHHGNERRAGDRRKKVGLDGENPQVETELAGVPGWIGWFFMITYSTSFHRLRLIIYIYMCYFLNMADLHTPSF